MSTKRAALIAKDCRALSNYNQQNAAGFREYGSINLNQNSKCEAATKFMQFESKNLSDSIQNTTNDFVNRKDYETSKDVSWGKNVLSKGSNLYPLQSYLQKDKTITKEEKEYKSNDLKKSTLSLHIEAYENATETQNIVVDEKVGDLKKSQQDPFTIPRQQKEEESIEAEVMAFKLSKPLLNLNREMKNKRKLSSPAHCRDFSTQQDFQHREGFVKAISDKETNRHIIGPMILPRLKPSTVLPFVRLLSTTSYQCASQGNTQLFKEVNRLAREGKWDALNNAPKPFLMGQAKEEANAVYAKIIQPEDSFYKYGGQPYGPWVFLVTRVAGYFAGLFILCKTYEFIVPEQYRLHYKHRPKHHHHEDEHH